MSVTTAKNHHVESVVELLQGWAEYGRTLTVASGDTHTVDRGETQRYSTVENAGTIENAGTMDSGFDPWTAGEPTVKKYWDDAQSERGPGADQPPIAYVWSPTDSALDQFSIEDDELDQTDTVEVQAWSLDATEARQLQDDITAILSLYLNDNNTETPYTEVRPTLEKDFREQKSARRTDHYIMAVEIETRGLEPTGVSQ